MEIGSARNAPKPATPAISCSALVVRAWTIQPLSVFTNLLEKDSLFVETSRRSTPEIPASYKWLARILMHKNSSFSGKLPWWFYLSKPDLRKIKSGLAPGHYVRLQMEFDQSEVAIFPLWAWNVVFEGGFLAQSRLEFEDWEKRLTSCVPQWQELQGLPEAWETEKVASWDCLFSAELPLSVDWDDLFSGTSSQIVVSEKLRLTQVRTTDFFHVHHSPTSLTFRYSEAVRLAKFEFSRGH
jgi:hypothetical protein